MLYKLVVAIAKKVLPMGVLLDALPPVYTAMDFDMRSFQTKSVFWYHGGPGRHLVGKLLRRGPCSASLKIGETELVFDVYRPAGNLASLRIQEVHLGEPNHKRELPTEDDDKGSNATGE